MTASLISPLLTRQLRVLVHAERLLSLQARDENRPPEFQHYASLSLALKLFDLIITHTGLGQDIEHGQAIEELLPVLEAMDRGAGREPERARAVRMAERVLATLYNDEGHSSLTTPRSSRARPSSARFPFSCLKSDIMSMDAPCYASPTNARISCSTP